MGLEGIVRGPFAAVSVNPTNMAVIDYVTGFRVAGFVRNGVGDVTLTFQELASVAGSLIVVPSPQSNVFCAMSYEPFGANGDEGVRIRCFDAAGAAFDPARVQVVIWRLAFLQGVTQ